ncbi:MAG: hypothetical protein ABI142_06605, partial [Bryocella sp.]
MQILPEGFSAITAHSLLAFVWAIVWALLVFAAISGYGAVLLRDLGTRRPTITLSALAGFAVTVFLGGILNAASLITVHILIAFVLLGVIACAFLVRRETTTFSTPPRPFSQQSLTARVLLLLALTVFGYRVIGSVHDCQLQDSDDFNYYLAAPLKILETHSFRGDVFSERRVMSSIGGNQFLATLILATQPIECTQMGDWMLGIFLLGLLAFRIGDEFDLTQEQRYALAFFLLITPQLRFNLTYVILPAAIFTGVVYTFVYRSKQAHWETSQAVIIGGILGAAASMKSSYVVHASLMVLFLA